MKIFKNKALAFLPLLSFTTLFTGCLKSDNSTDIIAIETYKLSPTTSSNPISFFRSTKISENITRISGLAGELMYLVEGTKKAALIDTGSGVGNLRKYVETLTKKPLTVLITHGHVDHAMGAPDFDEVYMNPADNAVYTEHSDLSIRKDMISFLNKEAYANLKDEDYVKIKPPSIFKPLNPGDIFDIGGTTLEICPGKGHTQGQITILFREERALLLGDAANPFTFLFGRESSGVTSYQKSMEELLSKTEGRFDKVYLSHGSGDGPKEILAAIIEVCKDIKVGNVVDEPYVFMGETAYIAKPGQSSGIANIVYKKEKVLD